MWKNTKPKYLYTGTFLEIFQYPFSSCCLSFEIIKDKSKFDGLKETLSIFSLQMLLLCKLLIITDMYIFTLKNVLKKWKINLCLYNNHTDPSNSSKQTNRVRKTILFIFDF